MIGLSGKWSKKAALLLRSLSNLAGTTNTQPANDTFQVGVHSKLDKRSRSSSTMAGVQQRDPLVEGCLQLARATGFKQPAEAGTATTRMQLTRAIRPANREAVQGLIDRYKAPDQAARIRALAADARAAGAHTPQQVDLLHVRRALQRRQAAMQQRAQEQEHAQAQLTVWCGVGLRPRAVSRGVFHTGRVG